VLQLVQSRPLAHFRLKPRLQWRYVAAAYKAFLDKFYNALLATNVPPWTSACMHPLKMVTKLEHSFQKQFRTGVIHQTWLTLHSGMIRVGPNRMTVYTPYPRYAVYPVPYSRFLTVYDRIWIVFAGGTPQTRVQFLAKAIFALFGPIFSFSRLFELSIPLTSYLLICMYLH
jgi:hypothetical protein